jgi:hypothetical protein
MQWGDKYVQGSVPKSLDELWQKSHLKATKWISVTATPTLIEGTTYNAYLIKMYKFLLKYSFDMEHI